MATAWADDWPAQGLDAAHRRASTERSGPGFLGPRWTTKIPGASWSTSGPAVAEGILVLGARDGSIHALRASTGGRLWQFKAGDTVLATPAIHRGRVFVPALDGKVYALRLVDGAVVWKKDLGGLEQSSPTVIGDSLLVAGGFPLRKVFRLDTATGKTLWESSADVMAQFSNSAAVSDGTQVIVGALGGHYYSFDLVTGAHLWTYESGGIVNVSAPVILDGRVFLLPGGNEGRLHAVDLATGKAASGWPVALATPPDDPTVSGKRLSRQVAVSSLSAAGDRLIFDVRFDDAMDDGSDGVPDRFLLREVVMAIRATDGHLLWRRDNGRLVVADPNDVPKNWVCPTPALYADAGARRGGSGGGKAGGVATSWVAVASTLREKLQVLQSSDGTPSATLTLGGRTRISPVMANGRLLGGTDDGVVQGFASLVNQPPAAPTLTGVGGEATVSSVSAVVTWGAALDPDGDGISYLVRADADGEILESWESEVSTGVGETRALLPRTLNPGRSYAVAVRARDSRGAWSEWSATQRLRVVETPVVSSDGVLQASLAMALRSARPGARIELGVGTFYLAETLNIPAGVSLAGAGPQRTVLQVTAPVRGLSIDGFVGGTPTTVTGLTVAEGSVGVAVRDTRDARISNVIVRDQRETGIEVDVLGSAVLTNATLSNNGRAVRSFGSIVVKNSIILDNHTGLVSDHPGAIVSHHNDLFRNEVAYQGMSAGEGDLASEIAFLGEGAQALQGRQVAGGQVASGQVASGQDWRGQDRHVAAGQPSTDKGDPADDFAKEPMPNGGRINLGAFGGTAEAELSPAPEPGVGTPSNTAPPSLSPAADAGAHAPAMKGAGSAAPSAKESVGCSVANAVAGVPGGHSARFAAVIFAVCLIVRARARRVRGR